MNTRGRTLIVSFVAIAWLATESDAQVVQLPSISTFSYSGTVEVPDQGTAFLGGNRSSFGRNTRRGLSHGSVSSLFSSNATVTATIIDHEEIDRQILGATPDEIRRRQRERTLASKQPVDPDGEGKALVRHARKMYREGNQSAAFASYQLAIRVLTPHLRDLAAAEFKRTFGSAADQALRMSTLRR